MDADAVEILKTEICHQGFFRLERVTLRHRRYDGSWSEPFSREMLRPPGAVAVLPYDPERDRLVLIEQFRLGPHLVDRPAWLIEVVGGMLEGGRTPEAVALAELEEEAGLTALDLVPITSYMPTPGTTTEAIVMFCARVDSGGAGGIHGLEGEHENIRVLTVPAAEVIGLLEGRRIDNAHTVIALQWFLLNHQSLRASWSDAPPAEAPGHSP